MNKGFINTGLAIVVGAILLVGGYTYTQSSQNFGARTVVGVRQGGTGIGDVPSYGQLLLGNSSGGYTLSATSTLGLDFSTTSTDYWLTTKTTDNLTEGSTNLYQDDEVTNWIDNVTLGSSGALTLPTGQNFTIGSTQWNSGDSIDGTKVANADLGSFSVSGGAWTIDSNAVTPNMVLSTGQTDEYCLTYESTGTTWEWQTCGSGGGVDGFDFNYGQSLGFGITGSSTTTPIGFTMGIVASTTSYFDYGSFLYATITNNLLVGDNTFFVDNTNNRIGINTTSPSRQLDVLGTSGGATSIGIKNTDTGTSGTDGTFFGLGASEDFLIWNYENTDLIFYTNNGTEGIRVDSTGLVGINDSVPIYNLDLGSGTLGTSGTVYATTTNSETINIPFDGTAIGAVGSINFGAGTDASIFWNGSSLQLDSTANFDFRVSDTSIGDWDTGGLNLVTGDTYQINNTDVLSNNTLGTGVLTSSLTTVGALDSGSITSGFGNIDIGSSNFDADGTITSTGVINFGGATSFEIPNGTSPTLDAIGQIALDTTDNQLLIATSTNATYPAVIPTMMSLGSFSIASTSPPLFDGFTSGESIPFKVHRDGYVVKEIYCDIDGGTSIVINFDNGTGNTETVTCDVDGASNTVIGANNSVSAGSVSTAIDLGTVTGTPNTLRVSIFGHYTRE